MASIDVGGQALGSRVRVAVTAVPPGGWVGLVALGAVVVLAWHLWDQDVEDTTPWTDPEQPPTNVEPIRAEVPARCTVAQEWGLNAMRGRRVIGAEPGAC